MQPELWVILQARMTREASPILEKHPHRCTTSESVKRTSACVSIRKMLRENAEPVLVIIPLDFSSRKYDILYPKVSTSLVPSYCVSALPHCNTTQLYPVLEILSVVIFRLALTSREPE